MDNDIITVQDSAPAISDDKIIQMAENAEKRIDAIKKIKEISLKVTNAKDWVDQQGRPYLQASGSTKVARVFGVSWRIEEPTFEVDEQGYITYTFRGEFSLAGSTIEALGVRSSKDPFFTTRYVDNNKKTLGPSEVDKGDVKKAALTNLLGNGITTILGIRNMTWAEIENVTNFTKEDVTNIQYKRPPKKDVKKQPPMKEPKSTHQEPQNDPGSTQTPIDRLDYILKAKKKDEASTKAWLKTHEVLSTTTVADQRKRLDAMTDDEWKALVKDIEFVPEQEKE